MSESAFTALVQGLLLPVSSTCRFYGTPEGEMRYTLHPEQLTETELTFIGVAQADARGRAALIFSAEAWEAARQARAQRRGRWAGHKGNCAACQEGELCAEGAELQALVRADCAQGGIHGKQ
jgi:hypothetical protein